MLLKKIALYVGEIMKKTIENPEVLKTWVLSTGHITKKDGELLDKHTCNEIYMVHLSTNPHLAQELDAGWRVYIGESFDEGMLKLYADSGFSGAFLELLKEATKLKVNWLEFDRDARPVDYLPQFDW
jgi:hypothetical protein